MRLFGTKLPFSMWGQAMHHTIWLRNRRKLSLLIFEPSARVDFANVLKFCQFGFALLYFSDTQRGKKPLPRSVFAHLIEMQIKTKLYRVYAPYLNQIMYTRAADFKVQSDQELPGLLSLRDGIARQLAIDEANRVPTEAE